MKGRNLQVIVKLADIILTPDNPSYDGGVWHVEGMKNEEIVASGIYYYDIHNTTRSRLHFRNSVNEPNYEQNDDKGMFHIYGLVHGEPLSQRLGYIETIEERCIVFPNMLQHKVESFELENPEENGHRRILVFFLVDPTMKITSTADIPQQQRNWIFDEISISTNIASVLIDIICDYAGLMDLAKAKEHRDALMKERKYIIDLNTNDIFEREFSLCEH